MHDPALRKQAKALRKQGLLISVIAVELGVPKPTVTRWLNPEFEKRERANARKRKYGKDPKAMKCPRCKRKKTGRAQYCQKCTRELATINRHWNRERVIAAIQRWAIEKGHAPVNDEWMLSGKHHPAISTITDGPNPVFRTWGEALIAAGFTPRQRRSGKRKYAPGELAAVRRRIREQKIINALQKENTDDHTAGVRDDAGVSDPAGRPAGDG